MNKDQKLIIQIYIAYIASILFNLIPSSAIQILGAIIFFVIFIATYVYRVRSESDSLTHNHMTYIIRSIWIASLLLIVGMVAAALFADHSLVYQTMDSMTGGAFYNEAQLESIMMDYIAQNTFVFIATLSPSFIYIFFRFIRGMMNAKDNNVISNLKSWL